MTPAANFVHAFDRFRRLNKMEKKFALQFLALLAATAIAVRVLRFDTVRGWLVHGFSSSQTEFSTIAPRRLVALIEGAARYVPGATCLVRALVAESTLRHFHYPADLHIGIKKTDPESLRAHAWIEVGSGERLMSVADYIDFGDLPEPIGILAR